MEITIENFETQVRAVLGVDDDILIPDSVISLPIYKDKAFRFVANKADYQVLDEDKQKAYKNAIVYKAALLLVPFFRVQYKKSEQSPHMKEENFEIDWPVLESNIKSMLDEEISVIQDAGDGDSFKTFFFITNQ